MNDEDILSQELSAATERLKMISSARAAQKKMVASAPTEKKKPVPTVSAEMSDNSETDWVLDAQKFVQAAKQRKQMVNNAVVKPTNEAVVNQTNPIEDTVENKNPGFKEFIKNAYNDSIIGMFRDLKTGELIGDIVYHKYADVFNKPDVNNSSSDEILRKYVTDFAERRKKQDIETPDPTTTSGKVGKFVVSSVIDLPLYALGGGLVSHGLKAFAGKDAAKGLIGVLAEKNLTQIANSLSSSAIKGLAKPAAITAAEGAAIGGAEMLVKSPVQQMEETGKTPTIKETAKDVAIGSAIGAVAAPVVGAGMTIGGKAVFSGGEAFAEKVAKPTMEWAGKFLPKHSESQINLQIFKANAERIIENPEIIEAMPGKTKEQTINYVRKAMDRMDAIQEKRSVLDDDIKRLASDAFGDFKSRAGININHYNKTLVSLRDREKVIQSKIIEMANRIKNGVDSKSTIEGERVFRGGNVAFDKALIGKDGVFVTPSRFMAETFGKNVDELIISSKAKVLSYDELPSSIKEISNWDDYSTAVARYGREKGVDVIDSLPSTVDFPRGMERTVLNPDVIKTKSQLTDIWNKSQSGTELKYYQNTELNRAIMHLNKIKSDRQKLNIAIENETTKLTLDEKRTAEMFSDSIKERIAKINRRHNELDSEMNTLANNAVYKNLSKANDMGMFSGKNAMKPSDLMTVRGVIVDPDIAKELSRQKSMYDKMDYSGSFWKKAREISKIPGMVFDQVNALTLRDVYRTAEKIDGASNGLTTKIVLDPVVTAKVTAAEALDARKVKFLDLLEKAGISSPKEGAVASKVYETVIRSSEQKNKLNALYALLDGKITDEQKKIMTPELISLAKFMRDTLNKDLLEYNSVAKRLNLPEVNSVKDYIKRVRKTSFFDDIGFTERVGERDASIIGTKRRSVGLGGSEKSRTGEWDGGYEEDPISSFLDYSRSALKAIHMQEPFAIARAHVNVMPSANRDYFNSYLNYEMGSLTKLDQIISDSVPAGKAWLKGIDFLKGAMGKSVIAGNLKVALDQPTTSLFTMAQTDAVNWIKSGAAILKDKDMVTDFVSKHSPLYKLRNIEGGLSNEFNIKLIPGTKKVDVGSLNPAKWVSAASRELDLKMYEHSFMTAYMNGKTKLNMSDKAAIDYANAIARKTQNIYDRALLSPMFRSKAMWPFTAFQSFAANLFNQMVHDPKYTFNKKLLNNDLGLSAKLIGGMVAANLIYKSAGLRSPFNIPFLSTENKDGGGLPISPTGDPGDLAPIVRNVSKYGAPSLYGLTADVAVLMTNYASQRDRDSAKDRLRRNWYGAKTIIPYAIQLERTVDAYEASKNKTIKVGSRYYPVEKYDPLRIMIAGKSNIKNKQ